MEKNSKRTNFILQNRNISYQEIKSLIVSDMKIEISPALIEEIQSCYSFFEQYAQTNIVYGVNTGFGPMAQYKIDKEKQNELQYNLIRSHASGMGNEMEPLYCKAILLDRIFTFSKCKSGIHISLLQLQIDLYNLEIYPVVYEHGGVGASGDLVQLAHFASAMIGEGKCWFQNQIVDTKKIFAAQNIIPIQIRLREGLALINGTSGMTGVSMINAIHAEKLLEIGVQAGTFINELMGSLKDYFSNEINTAKMHVGQNHISQLMQSQMLDSKLMIEHHEDIIDISSTSKIFKERVQEYYSLRCLPQILGPIYDTLVYAKQVIEHEFNSVSDNPIVDFKNKKVFHGGNFHGDYIALENDKIKIAIAKLSLLFDRQLNYLLNDRLNEKLPPFLNKGILGLNFGLQGIQYTSTSTVAENQMLSNPMYVHSIPSNKDNQDVVSMGFNAALIAKKVIDNTFQVLSIQLLALCEAAEILDLNTKLSSSSQKLFTDVRKYIPSIESDKSMSPSLNYLYQSLKKIDDI